MPLWLVTWAIDIEDGDAATPVEAAKLAAVTLGDPDVPGRSVYVVRDVDNAIEHIVDLDLTENDGEEYFS
jgi:hypothetical protein